MHAVNNSPTSKSPSLHVHVHYQVHATPSNQPILPHHTRPPTDHTASELTQHNTTSLYKADLATPHSLTRPQLLAVSATSNRQKGDKDPAEWLPDRAAYQCQYARAWVQVKQYYGLSVDSLEKAALGEVLGGC